MVKFAEGLVDNLDLKEMVTQVVVQNARRGSDSPEHSANTYLGACIEHVHGHAHENAERLSCQCYLASVLLCS